MDAAAEEMEGSQQMDGSQAAGDDEEKPAGDDEEAQEEGEEAEQVIDYSQDQRVAWMTQSLVDMDEFNVSKLTNEKLQKFFEYLENPDYVKFFVSLDAALEVVMSYDSAPKFFELNISAEQYQVAFFIKRTGKEPILMNRIDE
jgi:hypothetical protein